MQNQLLIFGYGYTASFLAQSLNPDRWSITATSRSKTDDKYCRIISYDKLQIEQALKTSTHILLSIPPNTEGDIVYQEFKTLIPNNKNIKWIGYLSSTGVYGNHDGAWVDEETNTNPSNQRCRNRVLAENQWLDLGKQNNICVNILRLPSIYGPIRNALSQVKSGKARSIFKKDLVFCRMHVSDIVQVIETAMNKALQNQIFSLADDYPCSPIEINNYAANLLQLPNPEVINFEDAYLPEMIKEFYNDSKRVSNTRIKERLGIKLQYPTYKEGLNKIFDEQNNN